MKKRIKYIKVEKSDAESLIQELKRQNNKYMVLDQDSKILYENNYVLFPINPDIINIKIIKPNLRHLVNYKIVKRKGIPISNYKNKSLKEFLLKQFPEATIDLIPKSFDTIGNIAILEFDQNQISSKANIDEFKLRVAESLVKLNKSISTVYEKKSEIKGTYRLRDFKLLYGSDNPVTIHKENHCTFKLNVKKVYFSPRLVFERNRINSLSFNENEIIIDLFAGVGPFSIQIAKKHNVIIYAFDVNPEAYYYLRENIRHNKLRGKITPYLLDVIELLNIENSTGKRLSNKCNRVIMNLPEKSLDYLKVACFLLKSSGGIIHIYQFNNNFEAIEKSIHDVQIALGELGWQIINIINVKVVKPYSPKSDLIVLDLRVKKGQV